MGDDDIISVLLITPRQIFFFSLIFLSKFCGMKFPLKVIVLQQGSIIDLVLSSDVSILLLLVQVFDGHGGKHAADFACYNLPNFIVKDGDFPRDIEKVVASAFLQTDLAFAEACSLDAALASGTTALAALVVGR